MYSIYSIACIVLYILFDRYEYEVNVDIALWGSGGSGATFALSRKLEQLNEQHTSSVGKPGENVQCSLAKLDHNAQN